MIGYRVIPAPAALGSVVCRAFREPAAWVCASGGGLWEEGSSSMAGILGDWGRCILWKLGRFWYDSERAQLLRLNWNTSNFASMETGCIRCDLPVPDVGIPWRYVTSLHPRALYTTFHFQNHLGFLFHSIRSFDSYYLFQKPIMWHASFRPLFNPLIPRSYDNSDCLV